MDTGYWIENSPKVPDFCGGKGRQVQPSPVKLRCSAKVKLHMDAKLPFGLSVLVEQNISATWSS